MDIYRNDPARDARRFESGTPPVPNIYAGLAGMQLVERLSARGIVTSSRENNLRISPHFYNNHGDVERVLEALRANKELLV
jgi:selenocysteine lyase/cysteine desulfurase